MTIPVNTDGVVSPTTDGMPQGTAISPVICILVLEHLGFQDSIGSSTIIQYADDGQLLSSTEEKLMEAIDVLFSRCQGGVKINPQKSSIINLDVSPLKFLGLTIHPDGNLFATPRSGGSTNLGNGIDPNAIKWGNLFSLGNQIESGTNTTVGSSSNCSPKASFHFIKQLNCYS